MTLFQTINFFSLQNIDQLNNNSHLLEYNILVGNPEGKRPLGRPRHRWEDNIRMDPREREWEIVDWMHLAQNRDQWQFLMNTVVNIRIP
jgi:hypothetical protein